MIVEVMNNTLKVLTKFKQSMKFGSLKEFHSYILKRGFTANYQHFAKILKGQATPTTDIIRQFNLAMPEFADDLTIAYCQDMFPQKEYLFHKQSKQKSDVSTTPTENHLGDLRQNVRSTKSSVLSEYQIATLCKNKENYFLFLICTMARKPILISELILLMGDKSTESAISDLVDSGIILSSPSGYQTFNTEIKFPAKSKFNENNYKKLDKWDLEFTSVMNMDLLVSKTLLRRVSPRYLGLINGQIQLLLESLRLSDESETKYNSEVVQLSISLFQGKLPG
jgi:hypothetical protein